MFMLTMFVIKKKFVRIKKKKKNKTEYRHEREQYINDKNKKLKKKEVISVQKINR